jgi:adenylate kinase family enzyme
LNGQRFISDTLAIELVKREVNRLERDGASYIIEGFPRSHVQALSLQQLGIVPDKVIVLKIKQSAFREQVKKNLKAAHTPLFGPQLDAEANKTIGEYKLNMKGVYEAYKSFIYEYGKYDPDKMSHNDVYYDLSQVLGLRYLKGQPRRVP